MSEKYVVNSQMMWPSITWVWAFLFIVHLSVHGTFGCLDEERSALLLLKTSINYPNGASLLSWDEESDCCSWNEVKCNSTTERIIQLHLYETRNYNMGDWYLNASLLLSFQELQSLDLSWNYLAGWEDREAFKEGDGLANLKILNLAGNNINESERILPYLEALTSLKSLNLRYNDMWFSNEDFRRLAKLIKLESLDLSLDLSDSNFSQSMLPYLALSLKSLYLSGNEFNVPLLIEELANLNKLEALDLSVYWKNISTKSIPPSIESLTSLKALDLSYNGLNDTESIQGLCKLKNLQELYLSENEFEGTIPLCLNNLTNLQVLDLSFNRFSGKIPTSVITSSASMAYLFLGDNNFSGNFALSSLAHLSSLKGIDLGNNDDLVVETEYPPWVPTFQLRYLDLSNCRINKSSSLIPSFLYYQYNLTHVDLSHSKLQGSFPIWLFENNTRLTALKLRNTSMTGTLNLPDHIIFKDFIALDISNNHLIGQIPIKIGALFPNLEILNMSRNALRGNIPHSVANMRKIQSLDLSYNSLRGELPNHLAAGCIHLWDLILSNNKLSGPIPSTYSNLTRLHCLNLDNNLFTGSISLSLFNTALSILDVGNNYLSGELPSNIGKFVSLSGLNLRGNLFEGQIPLEFCKFDNLRFLDLSKNHLYGSIPSCFNLSSLQYLHLEKNEFSGVIPSSLSGSSSLVTLDIRHNKIVDFLPSWIGSLSNLRALLMKGNYLHGPIPSEICKLKNLNILDLSFNNLSGSVPSCISNLTFGRAANLNDAFNNVIETYKGLIPYFSTSAYLDIGHYTDFPSEVTGEQQEVEFMTKSRSNSYKGDILRYMSGIDLSCNQLTGEIPQEIGQLIELRALNLSNNQLGGGVPRTLSRLRQIESLDLSHNKLTGTIPTKLVELNFLAVFKVRYNNLIGLIPQGRQFDTFEEDSYEGNTLLCGPPLKRSCFSPPNEIQSQQDSYNDNHISYFYGSFVGSYFVFLLATIVVLYYSKRFAIPCIN